MATDINKDAVEFARLGYKGASLNFCTDTRNFETFKAAIETAGNYNGFKPAKIADAFKTLFGEAMRVEFGREASPVIYVSIPFTEQQKLGVRGGLAVRISDDDRKAFTQQVIDAGKRLGADEISVQQHPYGDGPVRGKPGDHPYRVRMWWD